MSEVELGALLALLHGADPFRSVQATYRIWRHEERAGGVPRRRRRAEASRRFLVARAVDSGDPAPPKPKRRCGSGAMASGFAKSIMAATGTATTPSLTVRCGGSGTNAWAP